VIIIIDRGIGFLLHQAWIINSLSISIVHKSNNIAIKQRLSYLTYVDKHLDEKYLGKGSNKETLCARKAWDGLSWSCMLSESMSTTGQIKGVDGPRKQWWHIDKGGHTTYRATIILSFWWPDLVARAISKQWWERQPKWGWMLVRRRRSFYVERGWQRRFGGGGQCLNCCRVVPACPYITWHRVVTMSHTFRLLAMGQDQHESVEQCTNLEIFRLLEGQLKTVLCPVLQ
jgi:hypothetical protein